MFQKTNAWKTDCPDSDKPYNIQMWEKFTDVINLSATNQVKDKNKMNHMNSKRGETESTW